MNVTLHLDSIFLCFALVAGIAGMFAIKYWKR